MLVLPFLSIGLINAESKSCRAFAVGSKFRLEKAADRETFATWVDSLVGECAINFAPDRPNLVVFGELFGMVTALAGEDMTAARRAERLEDAFAIAGEELMNRFLYHKLSNMWFGISDERALFLSLTDKLYTPFFQIFPELAKKYDCYIIAGALSADVKAGSPSLTAWLMGYRNVSYSPSSNQVYNIASFWDPRGQLIGTTKKVYLTSKEIEMDLSRGMLKDVEVYDTPFGKVGIAISLDAFRQDYVSWLDDNGCQIIVQPDANDRPWADYHPMSDVWQPKEWMWSTFGSIQKEYENIQVNICPMIVGNFYELVFDGQSSITAKSDSYPQDSYVGVDLQTDDPYYHGRYKGKFLARGSWVMSGDTDEIEALRSMARSLQKGGTRENQYHEQIIWADIEVEP
ncbi:MAG: nitrilase-related carbon-nitrogen hydrolase [Candidatus Marinimicrobia bacterium]|nr:nitrilase-related carbon-nitrogen hydrolase [Candidatus Neomarinimicrobiota bacterium]MDP6967179.1 nitrilase-related carbon-nitrogen hydrolase [Candidatus Neomarinimicrobiota bacterium]